MKLQELEIAVKSLPTLMNISDEMHIIGELQKVHTEELTLHKEIFIEILDRIFESHIGGGIFQVNETNKRLFDDFANWLMLQNELLFNGADSELSSLAETVSTEFDYRENK